MDRTSGTWKVRVEAGANADIGHYIVAMNVRAVCVSRPLVLSSAVAPHILDGDEQGQNLPV